MSTGPLMSRLSAFAVAIALTLGVASAAQANTFNVNSPDDSADPGPCNSNAAGCTLRGAIQAANDNAGDDTIDVPPGRYILSISGTGEDANQTGDLDAANNGALTIQGTSSDRSDALVNANGIDRVLEVLGGANVTLRNLTVENGYEDDGHGGGISVDDGSTLNTDNVRVTKNVEGEYIAGGIFGDTDSTLNISNTRVDNNLSEVEGGGIGYYGSLTLTGSQADDNSAYDGGGGGVYYEGTSLSVANSSISHNFTDYDGGGLDIDSGDPVTVSDSDLSGNTAGEYGGAIVNYAGDLTIVRSTLNDNSAVGYDGYGGAIANDGGGNLTVEDSTLNDNVADYDGGAIVSWEGATTITGSTLDSNQSNDDEGGAVYQDDKGLAVENTTLNGNLAYDQGGAISNESGPLSVSGSTVDHNRTEDDNGGAIYNVGTKPVVIVGPLAASDADVTIDHSDVSDNQSYEYGGGIYNAAGTMQITGSHVDRNVAMYDAGGGIYVGSYAGDLTVSDSSVDGNSTHDDSGGGIYNEGYLLTVTRSSVDGNHAGSGDGGGIYNDGTNGNTNAKVVDSSISRNIAEYYGGGYYDNTAGTDFVNSTIADNQSDVEQNDDGGGGIYNGYGSDSLTNVTVAGNLSGNATGGGVYNSSGNTTLKNTIVAENAIGASDASTDCGGGNFVSSGNNISGDDSCGLTDGSNGDMTNTDPRLKELGNYGGSTQTMALKDDSPAIDAGDDSACADPVGNHDQRQAPRPVGAHCDIGAYEAHALGDLAVTKDASPSPVTAGGNLTYTIHAANNGPDSMLGPVTVRDTLPGGVTFVSATSSKGTCSGTSTVTCNLGAMADGQTATVTIVVKTGGAGTLTNTATIGGAPKDPDTSNNSATVRTQVVAPQVAAQQQSRPGPTVTPGPKACATRPPRTSISRPALHASSNALSFVGRSIDLRCVAALGIKKVQVAVAFKASHHRCRWLRKSGALTGARSCRKPVWLTARRGKLRNGKVPWTFRRRGLHLAKGSYLVEARGIDAHNDVEKTLRKYNRKSFRIG